LRLVELLAKGSFLNLYSLLRAAPPEQLPLGIASLRSGKLNFLGEVLSRKIYFYEYNYEYPLLEALKPWQVFDDNISKIIEPGFKTRPNPVSDHLAIFLKENLYASEQDARYLNWFDFFEFLISFMAVEKNCNPYFGSFIWRNETRRFLIKKIQDAALGTGKYGLPLQALLGGEAAFEKTAQEYDQIASQAQRDFGRTRPPNYIAHLIQLAKQGTRVSSPEDIYKILKDN
jgi:hypothetical protein